MSRDPTVTDAYMRHQTPMSWGEQRIKFAPMNKQTICKLIWKDMNMNCWWPSLTNAPPWHPSKTHNLPRTVTLMLSSLLVNPVDRGMFLMLHVGIRVCHCQHYGQTLERSFMNFSGYAIHETRNSLEHFRVDCFRLAGLFDNLQIRRGGGLCSGSDFCLFMSLVGVDATNGILKIILGIYSFSFKFYWKIFLSVDYQYVCLGSDNGIFSAPNQTNVS